MELGVSYFGNRILKHFLEDLKDIKAHHCTYVIHTFSENDHLFYKESMREIVQATKDAGLGVWVDPWGVGRVFGGEAFSNFTGQNPDSVQIANDGIPTHAACPNAPKFREFMAKWIDDAKYIGAEVLFWDEPHFYLPSWLGGRPGTWACTCQHCRAKWEERHPGTAFPTEITPEFLDAREDWLFDFLQFLINRTAEAGLKNALCLLPHDDAHKGAAENWEKAARMDNIDIIGTDPYWCFDHVDRGVVEFVTPFTQKLMKVAKEHNLHAHMWLQGFRIPDGREEELRTAMKIFVDEGCRDIAVWGFLACKHISWIRPANPDLVWQIVGEEFGKIKELS